MAMFLQNVIKILLPNLFTIYRLLARPVYLFMGRVPASRAELSWLIAAALTDIIDGRLARYFGTTSGFGAALDTTADKIFVLSVLLKLTLASILPKWLFGIVLAQYLLIALEGSIYLARFSAVPKPDFAARISAALSVAVVLGGLILTDRRQLLVLAALMAIGNFVHIVTAFLRITSD